MDEDNKIYIGNLDYGVTEKDLKEFIESKGFNTAEVKIIKDQNTNRSKGFGFAELVNSAKAQEAIRVLNGLELKSRKLRVDRARRKD